MSALVTPPADKKLESLHPAVRPVFERLIAQLVAEGYPVQVVETGRTDPRQAYLVSEGHSRRSWSPHQYREAGRPASLAIDLIDSRYSWKGPGAEKFFNRLAELAEELHLTSGHRWKWRDSAHVQAVPQSALPGIQAGGPVDLKHLFATV